jgi:hypothetical protein
VGDIDFALLQHGQPYGIDGAPTAEISTIDARKRVE